MSHAEIRDAKDGEFYFVIKDENGQILATSETYKTKEGCHQGIASLYTIQGNVYAKQMTVDATKPGGRKSTKKTEQSSTED